MDLTGMILKGRYCILEQIGEGGEGHLYLARDMALGCLWAVKEIPASRKREAKLLRLAEHPSIPKMVDYVEKEENCYLVMEYIRGKSLGQCLREGREFSLREAAEAGLTAARALKYLHSRKPPIYYCDMKPDNLMRQETGRLYLVDFGSAVLGYSNRHPLCTGTRGYAAPEQYAGNVGRTSDIYALGQTLRALAGKKDRSLLLFHPRFFSVIFRCCRKDEKRRFQDMEAVEEALLSLYKAKRGRVQGLCVGLLAAAAVFLGGGWYFLFGGEKAERPAFTESLSAVTEIYYRKEFLEGTAVQREKLCAEAERGLQKLLEEYGEKEQKRRVLLLLGANSECGGDLDGAELYYRELLRYAPGLREAYGEYGMLLWKLGEREKSVRLWEKYGEAEDEGILEEESTNAKLWAEKMKLWEEEANGEKIQERESRKTEE